MRQLPVSLPRGGRLEKRVAYARLGRVGRVRSPEFDMRASLPRRNQLIATLRLESSRGSREKFSKEDVGKGLTDASPTLTRKGAHVRSGNFNSPSQSPGLSTVLDEQELRVVFDSGIRTRLRKGDIIGALQGERVSRVMDIRLRRGTYTALMRACGDIRIALGLLVRAGAVKATPNAAMFNAALAAALHDDHDAVARRILSAMSAARIRPNGDTLRILLSHARSAKDVDAVRALLSARNGPDLRPGFGKIFVEGYLRVGGEASLTRSFSIINWLYEKRVGVTSEALNMIIKHCASVGLLEGAVNAWRELRRAWFGQPSRKARRMLLWAASQPENPDTRAARVILSRLKNP